MQVNQQPNFLSSLSHSRPLSLPERNPAIKNTLAQVAKIANYCSTHAHAIDHHGAFPIEEFKLIAEAGLLAAPLMPKWGGLGLGFDTSLMYELLIVLRQMGWGNLAVGRIFEGHVNALQLIQTFGTVTQIEQYAEAARDHHKIFGIWNAEANDGVKIASLPNQKYLLQGSKTFCSGASFVERPFVNGRLGEHWQMCIVPMEQVATQIDKTWWQPSGMRATASYKVDFSGVELEAQALIGDREDYHRQPWLSSGAIRFAAVQLGGAVALVDATRQYLQERGRCDNSYQETRMGEMTIAVEGGSLWLKGAADLLAAYSPSFGGRSDEIAMSKPSSEHLVNYVNMARTAIEKICMDVMQISERSVGTLGLLPPYAIERIIRDLRLYLRQPGFDISLQSVGTFALSTSKSVASIWHESSTI